MLHKKYLLLEKKACEEILFYFLFTAFISHFKSRLLHILKASKFAFPPQTLHRVCTVYHLKEKIGREMRQGFFTHLVCVHRRISSMFRRWWKKQQSSFLIEVQNVHSSHIQLKSQGLKKRSGRLAAPKKKLWIHSASTSWFFFRLIYHLAFREVLLRHTNSASSFSVPHLWEGGARRGFPTLASGQHAVGM